MKSKELGNFTLEEWKAIITNFSEVKLKKLRARAQKYRLYSLDFEEVRCHLHSEYLEFLKAYREDDKQGMIEEVTDISNCCDIIFSLLNAGSSQESVTRIKG